jgi:lactate dehydrogenase-like 2-hydroxyacid dehydrogenase
VKYVDLHEMFGESDVLALFAPSTPDNRHIVNRYSIGRMKKGVIIINTARGVCGHMPPSLLVVGMGCCVECPEVPHAV